MKWLSSKECDWIVNDLWVIGHILVLYYWSIPDGYIGIALVQFWLIVINVSESVYKVHKEYDK